MRCYHLCNFYLAGIQAGIQSAHTQHELAMKYTGVNVNRGVSLAKVSYHDWATHHKTMILLNGGMASDLLDVESMLIPNVHPYAWAAFREEEAALNNAITNIGIVLPKKIYFASRQITRAIELRKYGADFDINGASARLYRVMSQSNEEVLQLIIGDGTEDSYTYSEFDIKLMNILSKCSLMH